MKKIKYIFMFLLGMVVFGACTPEQDELFSDSATERSSKDIQRVHDILTSASNGWLMEFYGDLSSSGYGGYNVLLKFGQDSVTIASEKAGTSHHAGIGADGKCISATSHYKIEQSMGTVISMDEYNDVFHYFSMPNNLDYGTKDDGFLGDFEFRVISASADSVVLRGKKHSAHIRMYPVEQGRSWEQVLKDAEQTLAFMDSRNYTLGGESYSDQVVAYVQYHNLVFQFRDSIGDLQSVYAPFISTKDGYKFYNPVDVKGVTINGVLKGDNQDRFMLWDNNKMWLDSYLPTLAEHLTTSFWFIGYSNLGAYAQPFWDTFKTKFQKSKVGNQDSQLNFAFFGLYSGKMGIHFMIDGEYAYQGCTYTINNEEETEITMVWSPSNHNNKGETFRKKYGVDEAMKPFFGTRGRTFRIETDNQRHPSYLRLVDLSEPTNIITLTSDQINNPFDN